MLLTFIAVLLVIGSLVFVIVRRRYRSNLPLQLTLPEKCQFLTGHISMLQKCKINGFKELCVDAANSDGLSCFYLASSLCIGVTRAEHVKDVVQASSARLRDNNFDHHLENFLGTRSLLLMSGDEWKFHRHIIAQAFRWEHLVEMVSDMNKVATAFCNQLLSKVGQDEVIHSLVKGATMDVIGLTAFGFDFACIQSNKPSPVALAFAFLSNDYRRRQFETRLDLTSHFYSFPNQKNKEHAAHRKLLLDTVSDLVRARREAIASGKSTHIDMLTYLLDAHDEETSNKIDDASLTDNLVTLLGAGFDTSSITLSYALYLTNVHPEVEAKVLAEVFSVLGAVNMPTYDDLRNKFPYCTAVISETLRLYPPAPVTSRVITKPLTLTNTTTPVTIPAGVRAIIPIWWINRSAEHFDRPDVFDPDRFLPENSGAVNRFAFIPFSAGARDCVGRRFAMLELVTLFTTIMRAVKLTPLPGYELKTVVRGLVQEPSLGIPMHISRRIA